MSHIAALILAASTFFTTGKSALTLPTGTIFHTHLDQTISTANAYEGERLIFRVVPPYPSGTAHLQGTRISAYVTSITKPGHGNRARIGLVFARIFFPDGTAEPISAYINDPSFTRREPEDFGPRGIPVTVTPGPGTPPRAGGYVQNPTLWEARFGPKPTRPTGAYAYAARGGENLVLNEGQPYSLELARGLAVP